MFEFLDRSLCNAAVRRKYSYLSVWWSYGEVEKASKDSGAPDTGSTNGSTVAWFIWQYTKPIVVNAARQWK